VRPTLLLFDPFDPKLEAHPTLAALNIWCVSVSVSVTVSISQVSLCRYMRLALDKMCGSGQAVRCVPARARVLACLIHSPQLLQAYVTAVASPLRPMW
jgi:hypothetical protein